MIALKIYPSEVYRDSYDYYITTETYKREVALDCISSIIPVCPLSFYYNCGIRGVERLNTGHIVFYVDLSFVVSEYYDIDIARKLNVIVISNDYEIYGKDILYSSKLNYDIDIDLSSFNCVLNSYCYPILREEYLKLMKSNINVVLGDYFSHEYSQSSSFVGISMDEKEEIELFKFFIKIYEQDFHNLSLLNSYKNLNYTLRVFHSLNSDDLKYFLYTIFSNIPPSNFEFKFNYRNKDFNLNSPFIPSIDDMKFVFESSCDLERAFNFTSLIVRGNEDLSKWCISI